MKYMPTLLKRVNLNVNNGRINSDYYNSLDFRIFIHLVEVNNIYIELRNGKLCVL